MLRKVAGEKAFSRGVHEEGIDYPEGEACPRCPFWAGRDRWTGQSVT
jgi:hypothetical protein